LILKFPKENKLILVVKPRSCFSAPVSPLLPWRSRLPGAGEASGARRAPGLFVHHHAQLPAEVLLDPTRADGVPGLRDARAAAQLCRRHPGAVVESTLGRIPHQMPERASPHQVIWLEVT